MVTSKLVVTLTETPEHFYEENNLSCVMIQRNSSVKGTMTGLENIKFVHPGDLRY